MINQENNRSSKNLIFGTSKATRGAFYHNMNLQRSTDPNANRAEIVIALQKTSWFERLWYPLFILSGVLCLIFIRPFTFELCFSVLSLWIYMFASNFIARGNVLGIILSIISSALYTFVSFFAKVYGEVIINILLYIPLDILALISFRKNLNKNTNELDVKAMNLKKWLISISLLIISTVGVFGVLYIIPGQVYPFLNALSITLFLAAMFMRNLRYKEFWWLDLCGNLILLAMWAFISTSASDQLYTLPFALSSLAAFLNNIYGIVMWKIIYKKSVTNGGIYVKRTVKINKVIKIRRKMQALKWRREVEENRNKNIKGKN